MPEPTRMLLATVVGGVVLLGVPPPRVPGVRTRHVSNADHVHAAGRMVLLHDAARSVSA